MTRTQVVTLTPHEAARLYEEHQFPLQRNINKSHVKRLIEEMQAGRLVDGENIRIAIDMSDPLKKEYIIDGNHRLRAAMGSNVNVTFVISRTEYPEMDSIGRAYSRLDSGKKRSEADALRAMGKEGIMGSFTWDKNLNSAIPFLCNEFKKGRVRMRNEDRIDSMDAWIEYALMYRDAAMHGTGKIQGMLGRGAVMAAGCMTFLCLPGKAEEFWQGLAANDMLGRVDPRRTLLDWLWANNSSFVSDKRLFPCKAVAAAWNAFLKGEERQHINPASMKTIRFNSAVISE